MKPEIKAAYHDALREARTARERGDLDAAFVALERAHILGQRYLVAHIVTHLHMLVIGVRRRDAREVIGQLMRLLATVPGYLSGWVPKGNSGGANVSALRPMALQGDLAELLRDYKVWHDVARRVALYGGVAAMSVAVLAWADWRRSADAASLDAQWDRRTPQRLADFGSTTYLEIEPVVNWRARDGLKQEPGVSYLIRTDHGTVLFDLGYNRKDESPSVLEHNLAAIGVEIADLQALFISHAHRDHVGGARWERQGSFSFGQIQHPLPPHLRVLAPVPLHYPGLKVDVAQGAQAWMPGLATTGPIPRRLMIGRIDEQALVVRVAGRGLVAIVGCGHQTIPKLVTHIRETFSEPLIGIVGDVHYPVPRGRLFMAGLDVQRRLASGDGIWRPLAQEQVEAELDLLASQLQVLGLGAHDSSDEALALAADRFGARFHRMVAGEPLCIAGATEGEGIEPSASLAVRGACAARLRAEAR